MQKRRVAVSLALGASLALGSLSPAALADTSAELSSGHAATSAHAVSISASTSSSHSSLANGAPAYSGNLANAIAQSVQDLKVSETAGLPLAAEQASVVTTSDVVAAVQEAYTAAQVEAERVAREESANKTLPVNWDLISAIGTQETTGHSSCCPGFACAYGDAIVRGVANGHAAYGCGCCTWPGWGGGNSSFRSLGSSQAVLREAYDQIQAGYPVVTHVSASYGQHWVTLVGYQNVEDPNALSTVNFVCIDPWDGRMFTLSDMFVLYGDNCQHVSELSPLATA